MDASAALRGLEALIARLRELIGAIEDPWGGAERIEGMRRACERELAAWKSAAPEAAELDPQQRERLRAGLEEALQLNAIAVRMAEGGLAGLERTARLAGEVRRRAGKLGSSPRDSGRSCDVSG